jgi:hypothetical protein
VLKFGKRTLKVATQVVTDLNFAVGEKYEAQFAQRKISYKFVS